MNIYYVRFRVWDINLPKNLEESRIVRIASENDTSIREDINHFVEIHNKSNIKYDFIRIEYVEYGEKIHE